MSRSIVLVRACGGQPLRRVFIHTEKGLVFVVNPDSITAVEKGDSIPIGFPRRDIFSFSSDIYQTLQAEFVKSGTVLVASWDACKRFVPDEA